MNEHHAGGGRQPIDFSAIRAGNPIAETVGRYLELKRQGGEYKARCPFHNDRNPSFAVVPAKGKAFCNACHWAGDVIDFVAEFESIDIAEAARRLSGGELPTERPNLPPLPPDEAADWTPILPVPDNAPAFDAAKVYNPRRGREVNWSRIKTRQDAYRGADGRLLGYVVRLEIDGSKQTIAVTWARHKDGRECWASVKFPEPTPLQGLDDLAGRPDAPVLVVSGEKCRAAAAKALPGFVAVTWIGGDNRVGKADWTPLNGRHATFWPDADDSGIQGMHEAARLACAHTARFLDVSGLRDEFGEKTDVADLVAAGWDTARIIDWAKRNVGPWTPPKTATPACAGADAAVGGPALASLGEGETGNKPATSGAADATPVNGFHGVPKSDIELMPRLRANMDEVDDEDQPLPAKYSELNASLAFARKFEENLRYVDDWGRWMVWNGSRWQQDRLRHAMELGKRMCTAIADHARMDNATFTNERQKETVVQRYGEKRTIMNVSELAKSDPRIAAATDQWDADKWLLNTPDGVVDLRTGNARPGQRADYMTKMTRVAPGGDCPQWRAFLDTATAGDKALQDFLQRLCGYTLTGEVREQILVFVYGPGGNGKGTFLNTLHWILGDYSTPASMDVFTERKHESHPTELAGLMGARLVTAQETEEGKRWNESRIKALTGGDPIKARFMRQDEFEFMPQFQLIIAGNHKPGLRNVDEAIKRRMRLVPFDVTIPPEKRDPMLADKLRAEAGGILAWAIEGCQLWQRDGLRAPERVLAATEEYLEQQDSIGAWIDECCDQGNAYSCRRGDLYKSFKAWAERTGEFPLPQKRWVAAIETRGIRSRMSGGIAMCDGLRVRQAQNGGWEQQQDDWRDTFRN